MGSGCAVSQYDGVAEASIVSVGEANIMSPGPSQ